MKVYIPRICGCPGKEDYWISMQEYDGVEGKPVEDFEHAEISLMNQLPKCDNCGGSGELNCVGIGMPMTCKHCNGTGISPMAIPIFKKEPLLADPDKAYVKYRDYEELVNRVLDFAEDVEDTLRCYRRSLEELEDLRDMAAELR